MPRRDRSNTGREPIRARRSLIERLEERRLLSAGPAPIIAPLAMSRPVHAMMEGTGYSPLRHGDDLGHRNWDSGPGDGNDAALAPAIHQSVRPASHNPDAVSASGIEAFVAETSDSRGAYTIEVEWTNSDNVATFESVVILRPSIQRSSEAPDYYSENSGPNSSLSSAAPAALPRTAPQIERARPVAAPESLLPRDLPAAPSEAALASSTPAFSAARVGYSSSSNSAAAASATVQAAARLPAVGQTHAATRSALASAESFIVHAASAESQWMVAAGTIMNAASHVAGNFMNAAESLTGVITAQGFAQEAQIPETLAGSAMQTLGNAITPRIEAAFAHQAASMAKAFFHIAPIDATGLFSDSLAAFARDSAGINIAAGQIVPSRRAWAITAGVLAVDAMLVAHWYAKRRKAAKAVASRDGDLHYAG